MVRCYGSFGGVGGAGGWGGFRGGLGVWGGGLFRGVEQGRRLVGAVECLGGRLPIGRDMPGPGGFHGAVGFFVVLDRPVKRDASGIFGAIEFKIELAADNLGMN